STRVFGNVSGIHIKQDLRLLSMHETPGIFCAATAPGVNVSDFQPGSSNARPFHCAILWQRTLSWDEAKIGVSRAVAWTIPGVKPNLRPKSALPRATRRLSLEIGNEGIGPVDHFSFPQC